MSSRKRKPSREKKINPKYWVFCEGKTEAAYVSYLRSRYRLPIEIISETLGSKINQRLVNKYKSKKQVHEKDKTFLLYDGDVAPILERLKSIEDTELLISTPAIEYWFLLHYKNQTAEISGDECIRQLSNRNNNTYKKGFIDSKLKVHLETKCQDACKRAEKSNLLTNPSTSIDQLIKQLEEVKALRQ